MIMIVHFIFTQKSIAGDKQNQQHSILIENMLRLAWILKNNLDFQQNMQNGHKYKIEKRPLNKFLYNAIRPNLKFIMFSTVFDFKF